MFYTLIKRGARRVLTETLLPNFIKNQFTYAEGHEARVSLYFAK